MSVVLSVTYEKVVGVRDENVGSWMEEADWLKGTF